MMIIGAIISRLSVTKVGDSSSQGRRRSAALRAAAAIRPPVSDSLLDRHVTNGAPAKQSIGRLLRWRRLSCPEHFLEAGLERAVELGHGDEDAELMQGGDPEGLAGDPAGHDAGEMLEGRGRD